MKMKQRPDEVIATCYCGSHLFFYDGNPECISCSECFSVRKMDENGYLLATREPSPYDEPTKHLMMDTYPRITLRTLQRPSVIDMMLE